jgi:hypothetical protein
MIVIMLILITYKDEQSFYRLSNSTPFSHKLKCDIYTFDILTQDVNEQCEKTSILLCLRLENK